MTETEACVALNMVPNLGPVRLRKLLAALGSPEAVLRAAKSKLRQVDGIGPELADAIGDWEKTIDLAAELARVAEFGAGVITQASPEYPPGLRELHNPPIVLYVWGTITSADFKAVGVVGSRKTSHYGTECAKKLSYQLAYAGLTVVSGLARGIDTAAHQGALAANGRTIGVIGSGLMDLYPPENAGLAEKIAASGAVVSEFPMTFPPSPQTFPYRNRIVAGWGRGVLVVEAGAKSGALITAEQALENGRLVYAVPGQIDRPTSFGSNRLIQQGAKLITSAGDILDDMHSLFPEPRKVPPPTNAAPQALGAEESAVLDALGGDTLAPETIAEKSSVPLPKVSAILLTLELKRQVRQLPGRQFVRSVAPLDESPSPAE
ncbi:MAG: DNA-processing protein DprA [Chthoniobacteraceae bacterium]